MARLAIAVVADHMQGRLLLLLLLGELKGVRVLLLVVLLPTPSSSSSSSSCCCCSLGPCVQPLLERATETVVRGG